MRRTPKTAIRGGFGTGYVHYTRAGSGDILASTRPQAQFAAVSQITPSDDKPLHTPLPAQIIAVGYHHAELLRHCRPGIPFGPGDHLQPGDRQHHLGSKEHARQLRGELLPQRAAAVGEEHAARCRLRRQPRAASAKAF